MSGRPSASTTGADAALLARAQQLHKAQRFADALRLIEAAAPLPHSSATSGAAGGSGQLPRTQAFWSLTLYRACALYELGRYEAAVSVACLLQEVPISEEDAARRDAVLMRCHAKLRSWRRCAEYATALVVQSDDDLAVEAFCTLGKAQCVAWSSPEAAADFYIQALERDWACSTAWDAIVDLWLVAPNRQRELLAQLAVEPSEAEAVRGSYYARIAPALVEADASGDDEATNDALAMAPLHLQRYAWARRRYLHGALREALAEVAAALQLAPENIDCLTLKLVILVDLRATNELFSFSHAVADELRPSTAMATYAVGCYHFSVASFDQAGRFFGKTTEVDPHFAPGWIAYGHCYARLEEGEQALHAYRRAQSIFPAMAAIRTYIGMQHLRAGSATLARCFLEEAGAMHPNDPLTLNELGVLAMRHDRDLNAALTLFTAAYDALPDPENPCEYLDCILFNLGTVLRRLQEFDRAVQAFRHYVRVRPYAVAGHCALGLTLHLIGQTKEAIRHYHVALGLKHDTVCRDLLERALEEEMAPGAVSDTPGTWGDGGGAATGLWDSHDGSTRGLTSGGGGGGVAAHPGASPSAATPTFSLSAISRIARSESQPAGAVDGPSPQARAGGINRALAF